MIKKYLCLLLAAVLLCTAASCKANIGVIELSSGYESRGGEAVVSERFSPAALSFSLKLFRALSVKDGKSSALSPLSVMLCTALLANGADGDTKAQLEEMLGMDIEELSESLSGYINSLDGEAFSSANSIWINKSRTDFTPNDAFLQTNADLFSADVFSAPFDEKTRKSINSWCKKSTDGLINEMLDKITENALLYLVSTVLFDAKWAEKYESKDIIEGQSFFCADGSRKECTVMTSSERTYLSGENFSGFCKDYEGGNFSFTALLPDEGVDIYDFIGSLECEKWAEMWQTKSEEAVNVLIPELDYKTEMNLGEALSALGATDMFDENKADFSRMGKSGGNIYCSEMKQKAAITVDSNGTKAAAATWAIMVDGASPECEAEKAVYLTRPFVYAVVDNKTGLPLLLGTVTKP